MDEEEQDLSHLPGELGDFVEDPRKQTPEQRDLAAELDMDYKFCFETEAGQRVLKHLRDTTIEKPCLNISDGLAGIMLGYSNEGKNALVRDIEKRIQRAKEIKKEIVDERGY